MTNVESRPPHLGWHSRGYVPHWDHPGMIQSLNFRLGDALPKQVLEKWQQELGLRRLGAPASRRHKTASDVHHESGWQDASASRNEAERNRAVELRRRIE